MDRSAVAAGNRRAFGHTLDTRGSAGVAGMFGQGLGEQIAVDQSVAITVLLSGELRHQIQGGPRHSLRELGEEMAA